MTGAQLVVHISQSGEVNYQWFPAVPIPDQTTLDVLSALARKFLQDVNELHSAQRVPSAR